MSESIGGIIENSMRKFHRLNIVSIVQYADESSRDVEYVISSGCRATK